MRFNLKVASSFEKGAEHYDSKAFVQPRVNENLFHLITQQEPHLNTSTVLEVGAGTGDLSAQLAPLCGTYVTSDISPTSVNTAYRKTPEALPIVIDAQAPPFMAGFDIIVSSLALHWLQSPHQGLLNLIGCLKPGGRLYLTSMGAASFYEWRTAHTLLGLPCGTPDFIASGSLKSWLPAQGERNVSEEWIVQQIEKPLSYFRNLKRIGAGFPHPAHKPLPASDFRKVLEKFSKSNKLSYQILYLTYKKPEDLVEEE